jgi:hypothetical protein
MSHSAHNPASAHLPGNLTFFHPKPEEVVTGVRVGSAVHKRLVRRGFEQSNTRRPAQPPQHPMPPRPGGLKVTFADQPGGQMRPPINRTKEQD